MGRIKISKKKINYPKINLNIIIMSLIISIFVFLIGRAIGKRETYNHLQEKELKKRLMLLNEI